MKHVTLAVMLLILFVCHAVNSGKITLDYKRAKGFFQPSKRFWWWKSDEGLREECYTKGCIREEVNEKFGVGQQANEYYREYKCEKDPDTCSSGPSVQS